MDNRFTLRITESAILLAVGIVLSMPFLNLNSPWLMGGSVTLGAMLPLVLISYRYKTPWGLLCALVYSITQIVLGLKNVMYAPDFVTAAAVIVLDYVLAFGVIGLAYAIGSRVHQGLPGVLAGIAVTYALRFLCHLVSGAMIWQVLWPNEDGTPPWLYSLIYNGSYMLPETLIAMVIAGVSYAPLQRFWTGGNPMRN